MKCSRCKDGWDDEFLTKVIIYGRTYYLCDKCGRNTEMYMQNTDLIKELAKQG